MIHRKENVVAKVNCFRLTLIAVFAAAVATFQGTRWLIAAPTITPDSHFELFYSSTVHGTDGIDTKKGLLLVDDCSGSSIKYRLKLSVENKRRIMESILETGLLDLKDGLVGECPPTFKSCAFDRPSRTITLRILVHGISKSFSFASGSAHDAQASDLKKFEQVKAVIYSIFLSTLRESGKKPPKCGYS